MTEQLKELQQKYEGLLGDAYECGLLGDFPYERVLLAVAKEVEDEIDALREKIKIERMTNDEWIAFDHLYDDLCGIRYRY